MKNFDYLKDIESLKDLYGFCNAAEDTQQTNYDVCALNGRRALEWMTAMCETLYSIVCTWMPPSAMGSCGVK